MFELAAGSPDQAQQRRVQALQRQINRFVAAGIVVPRPVPTNGVLDTWTATAAMSLLVKRASTAVKTWSDPGSSQLFAEALTRVASPRPWLDEHLSEVTAALAMYGDSLRLPPVDTSTWRTWATSIGLSVLILGAVGAVGYLVHKQHRLETP